MNRRNLIGSLVIITAVLMGGCYTPSGQPDRTATGALMGGMLGAGTGALIGNAAGHNTAAGAAIGGAVGLLSGALIGNAMDQEHRAALRAQSPQTLQRIEQGQPLSLADIKALAKADVSDEVIISQIKSSRTAYHLSTAEIIELKDAGVSNKVIDYLINTPGLPGSTTMAPVGANVPPPPSPIAEEVVVAPGPGYVWVNGYWDWTGIRWVWIGGRWCYPPYPHALWVGGGWYYRGPHRYWAHGYWR